jgi:hypothetical protein
MPTDNHTLFADGYIAGWNAIIGAQSDAPNIPATPNCFEDKTPFQAGIRRGIEDARSLLISGLNCP